MTNFDDRGRMILRNMLLGIWAAEKLGIAGREADADRTPSLGARSIPPAATYLPKFARTSTTPGWRNRMKRPDSYDRVHD